MMSRMVERESDGVDREDDRWVGLGLAIAMVPWLPVVAG